MAKKKRGVKKSQSDVIFQYRSGPGQTRWTVALRQFKRRPPYLEFRVHTRHCGGWWTRSVSHNLVAALATELDYDIGDYAYERDDHVYIASKHGNITLYFPGSMAVTISTTAAHDLLVALAKVLGWDLWEEEDAA